jgi:uncharacterized membrane protein (UPF0127 family)
MNLRAKLFASPVRPCVTLLTLTFCLTLLAAAKASAEMPTATIGNGNVVKLEVASTWPEIEKGLMYRTSLAEDSGMVFIFHPAQEERFWMYHTLISLDMCFIRDGKIVKLFEDVPPCHSEDPHGCPTYPADRGINVSEVIELKAGYAKRHNIKEGDPVKFEIPGFVPAK